MVLPLCGHIFPILSELSLGNFHTPHNTVFYMDVLVHMHSYNLEHNGKFCVPDHQGDTSDHTHDRNVIGNHMTVNIHRLELCKNLPVKKEVKLCLGDFDTLMVPKDPIDSNFSITLGHIRDFLCRQSDCL